MLQVEPQVIANWVAEGSVQLTFWHVLDHGDSPVAHRAAECAGAQSPLKFWEMHDQLFARQNELWGAADRMALEIATGLGLDTAAFSACMADPAVAEKVTRMDATRRAAGIRLRPTFDINGRILPGAQPYSNLVLTFQEFLGP